MPEKYIGYYECCNAIKSARFPKRRMINGSSWAFDPYMLEEIRDIYGYDLYCKCMTDVVMELNNA